MIQRWPPLICRREEDKKKKKKIRKKKYMSYRWKHAKHEENCHIVIVCSFSTLFIGAEHELLQL